MSLITYKAHELQLHKEVGSAVASKALTESLRGEVTQVLNTFPTEDRSQIRSFLLCEDDGEFLCLYHRGQLPKPELLGRVVPTARREGMALTAIVRPKVQRAAKPHLRKVQRCLGSKCSTSS
jgi:hypothetical protein